MTTSLSSQLAALRGPSQLARGQEASLLFGAPSQDAAGGTASAPPPLISSDAILALARAGCEQLAVALGDPRFAWSADRSSGSSNGSSTFGGHGSSSGGSSGDGGSSAEGICWVAGVPIPVAESHAALALLLGESSKYVERARLTDAAARRLDAAITHVCLLLQPYFLHAPAQQVFEWLLRHFEVHRFNLDAVMMTVLPYHHTNLFARLLRLLRLRGTRWVSLIPLQKEGGVLDRATLVQRASQLDSRQSGAQLIDFIAHTGMRCYSLHAPAVAAGLFSVIPSVPLMGSTLTGALRVALNGRTGTSASGTDSAERFVAAILPHIQAMLSVSSALIGRLRSDVPPDEHQNAVLRVDRAVGEVHAAGLMVASQLVSSVPPSVALVDALLQQISEQALLPDAPCRASALRVVGLLCTVLPSGHVLADTVVHCLIAASQNSDSTWWLRDLARWSLLPADQVDRTVPDARPLVSSVIQRLCHIVKSPRSFAPQSFFDALRALVAVAVAVRAGENSDDAAPLRSLLGLHVTEVCSTLCVVGAQNDECAELARAGLIALAESFPKVVDSALNLTMASSNDSGVVEFTTRVFAGTSFAVVSGESSAGAGAAFTTLLECAKSDQSSSVRLAAMKQLRQNASSSEDRAEIDSVFANVLESGDRTEILSLVLDAVRADARIVCGRGGECTIRRVTDGCMLLARYFSDPTHAHSALDATWAVLELAAAPSSGIWEQRGLMICPLVAFQVVVLYFFSNTDATWAAASSSAATIIKAIELSALSSALPLLDCLSEALSVASDEVTLVRCLCRAAARGTDVLLAAFSEVLKGAESSVELARRLSVPLVAAKHGRLLLLAAACRLLQDSAEGVATPAGKSVEVVRALVQYLVDCEATNTVVRRSAKRYLLMAAARDFAALCSPGQVKHVQDAACWAFVCLLQCAPSLSDSAVSTIRTCGSITSAMRPSNGMIHGQRQDRDHTLGAVSAYRFNLRLLSSASTTSTTEQLLALERTVHTSLSRFAGAASFHALCYFATDTATTLDTRVMCILQIEFLLIETRSASNAAGFDCAGLPAIGPVLVASLFVSLGSDFEAVRSASAACFKVLAELAHAYPLSVRRLLSSTDMPVVATPLLTDFCTRVLQWSRDVAHDRHAFVRALADTADPCKWDAILCMLLAGAVRLPSAIVGRKLVELIDPTTDQPSVYDHQPTLRWGPRVYGSAWRALYQLFSGDAFVGSTEGDADSAWVPFADALLPILFAAAANDSCSLAQHDAQVGQLCDFLNPRNAASSGTQGDQDMQQFVFRHIERAHALQAHASARKTWYASLPPRVATSFYDCLLSLMLMSQEEDGDSEVVARRSALVRSILQSLPLCVDAVDGKLRVFLASLLVDGSNEETTQMVSKRRKRGVVASALNTEPLRAIVALLELLQVALDETVPHSVEHRRSLARVLLTALSGIVESSVFDKQFTTLRRDVSNAEYAVQLCVLPLLDIVRAFNSSGERPEQQLFADDDYSILLNVLRVTTTPHTHNSIIALLALCARSHDLAVKQVVLRHTLPLFTYLGANSVRKDDDYTYAVVDDAVSAIVPAILDQPESSGSITPTSLVNVFADACSMVPLHRRLRLFSHLIHTLGPKKYLAELVVALMRSAHQLEESRAADSAMDEEREVVSEPEKSSFVPLGHASARIDTVSLCHSLLDAVADVMTIVHALGSIVLRCSQATMADVEDVTAEIRSSQLWSSVIEFVKGHVSSEHFRRVLSVHMASVGKLPRRQGPKRQASATNSIEQELVKLLHAGLSLTYRASFSSQRAIQAGGAVQAASKYWQTVADDTHEILIGITRVLPTRLFMSQIVHALDSEQVNTKTAQHPASAHAVSRYLSLFSSLLEATTAADHHVKFSSDDASSIMAIRQPLCDILQQQTCESTCSPIFEPVVQALELLVQVFGHESIYAADFANVLACIVSFSTKCLAAAHRDMAALPDNTEETPWVNISAYTVVCVGTLVHRLGAQAVPFLPEILRALLRVLHPTSDVQLPFMLRSAAISGLHATVRAVGQFVGNLLPEIIFDACILSSRPALAKGDAGERVFNEDRMLGEKSEALLHECVAKIHPRLLLPALSTVHSRIARTVTSGDTSVSVRALVPLSNMLADMCSPETDGAGSRFFQSPKVVRMHHQDVFRLLLSIFELRETCDAASITERLDSIDEVEKVTIGAFTSLVVRLSENLFKPLFVSLLKWAALSSQTKRLNARVTVSHAELVRGAIFYKISASLLSKLMALFVPLISYCSEHAAACLSSDPVLARYNHASDRSAVDSEGSQDSDEESSDSDSFFAADEHADETPGRSPIDPAWSGLVEGVFDVLTKTFRFDTESGGRLVVRDKLPILLHPIVNSLRGPRREFASKCLVKLGICLGDEKSLRPLNLAVFQLVAQTADPAIRVCALECVRQLHSKLGEALLGLVPETVPFLAELLEDAHVDVERAAQRLIQEIERHLGENSIASYL